MGFDRGGRQRRRLSGACVLGSASCPFRSSSRRHGCGATPALQSLDAGQQRLARGVELGPGGLDERKLEPRARVSPGAHGLHRLAQQLQQADEGGAVDALRLSAQGVVGLRGERQLCGDLLERRDHEQLARPQLQVRCEGGRIVPLLDACLDRLKRASRIALGDGIDRVLQQLRVGHAEHGEHVLDGDRAAAVGDQLLERAQGVAEAPRRRARESRDRGGRDLD